MAIPSDFQNHDVPLAHERYLGIVKTKGLHRKKVYFSKLDELVKKLHL